jgi:hypothetical protein
MRALRTHIMTHPNDYIAYDLRCLCALHCNDFSLALSDAIQCTTLNPTWYVVKLSRYFFPFFFIFFNCILKFTKQNTSSNINKCRARGWARLGAAQLCMGHPTAAASAYTQGLRLEPKNEEMLMGMELAKRSGHARGGKNRRAAMHDGDN